MYVERFFQKATSKLVSLVLSTFSTIVLVGSVAPQTAHATLYTDIYEVVDYDSPYMTIEVEVDPIEDSILDTIDTETTIYPHSEYFLVEAEVPSDRIEINEDTLYSQNDLLPFADTSQQYSFPYFNAYRDSFRDMATYVDYYLYYSSDLNDHYLVPPMNITDEVSSIANLGDLIIIQGTDISHKLRQYYFADATDDLLERYELKQYIPTSIYADAKASMLRAEDLYSQMDSSDSDYDFITERMDEMREDFKILTARYNNGQFEDHVVINVYVSEELEDNETLQANLDAVEEAVQSLPSDFLRRLSNIYMLDSWEMPTSEVAGFTLHGFAMDDGTVYYVGDEIIYKNLVYHEFGHTLDFATSALVDWDENVTDSLSSQEDWQAIFEEEWADEDSYYHSTTESFAEGFGVYALEYFLGETPDLSAYPDSSLEDRPQTRAYFEELFETLGY